MVDAVSDRVIRPAKNRAAAAAVGKGATVVIHKTGKAGGDVVASAVRGIGHAIELIGRQAVPVVGIVIGHQVVIDVVNAALLAGVEVGVGGPVTFLGDLVLVPTGGVWKRVAHQIITRIA